MRNIAKASQGLNVDAKARVTSPIKPDPAFARAKLTVDRAFKHAALRVDIGGKRSSPGL